LLAEAGRSGYEADVDDIPVSEGDVIRFEVHASGNGPSDVVSWTPSIGYVQRPSPSHPRSPGALAHRATPEDPTVEAQPADGQNSESAELRVADYSTRSASTGLTPAARLAGR